MTEPAKDVILCLLIAIVVVAFGACMRDCDVRTDVDYQRDRAREHAVELACLRARGLYHDGACVPACGCSDEAHPRNDPADHCGRHARRVLRRAQDLGTGADDRSAAQSRSEATVSAERRWR